MVFGHKWIYPTQMELEPDSRISNSDIFYILRHIHIQAYLTWYYQAAAHLDTEQDRRLLSSKINVRTEQYLNWNILVVY